jgi:tRNA(adenine34) deaminase
MMRLALEEARQAATEGEVPIGAVLASGEDMLARDHNRRERIADPTAHAEVLVLRRAAASSGEWRLDGTTLYVTLEPCPMCAGAIVLARVKTVVFGSTDVRAGAGGSAYDILEDGRLDHKVEVIGGVLEEECHALLSDFFEARREDGTERA